MNKIKKLFLRAGLGLTYTGVLLLATGYLANWLNSNLYLMVCLALIVSGVVFHVIRLKSESEY